MMQQNNDSRNNLNNYAKYSGVAFEMLGIIVLGVWGGLKLDERLGTKPLLTVVFSLGAVALAIYNLIVKIRR